MALADIRNGRIEIDTKWNERELVKQIPGARWDAVNKTWHLPTSWSACIVLRGVFKNDLTIGSALFDWASKKRVEIDVLTELRTRTTPHLVSDTRLYPFQQVGKEFMMLAGEALIGDEMGTGKTIQALVALEELGSYPAIVICPNSVKIHWADEANKWAPSAQPYVITGGATARKKILSAATTDPNALIIVNYEALRTLTRLAPYGSTRLKRCRECDRRNGEENITATQCQVHPKALNNIAFRTVIVDEAHRIKDPRSQQTRAVWAVAHGAAVHYRWALTGTPLANHPGDLWSVLHCISPTDFPTKTHFVDRYCLQSWNAFGGLDIVGVNPANRDEFFNLLDPRFRRMPKALVLSQLPPKVRSTRWVELGTAQRRQYEQLNTGLATMTSGGVLVAPNALVAKLRLMQFASSTVTVANWTNSLDDMSVVLTEPSPKLDELEAIFDEMPDKPIIVCAESRQLIDLASIRLSKRKIPHGLITGTVNEFERQRVLREFQAGRLQALLFTVKAGGVGLTMTAADTIVFLQRSWSMIDNKQAEDRAHRIGSERHESIHVIDIVARDTVEEGQIARLTEKFMRLQEIARDRLLIGDQQMFDEEEAQILNSEL